MGPLVLLPPTIADNKLAPIFAKFPVAPDKALLMPDDKFLNISFGRPNLFSPVVEFNVFFEIVFRPIPAKAPVAAVFPTPINAEKILLFEEEPITPFNSPTDVPPKLMFCTL